MQTKVPAKSPAKKNKRGEIGACATKTVTDTGCLGEKEKREKILEQSPQQPQPELSLSRDWIYLAFAWRRCTTCDRCAMYPVIRAERDVSI